MPPPVVGLVKPPASPTTSRRSPWVRAIGRSGSRRRIVGSGAPRSRAPISGRSRNARRQAPASPVAITPTFIRARPSRTIGTVHDEAAGRDVHGRSAAPRGRRPPRRPRSAPCARRAQAARARAGAGSGTTPRTPARMRGRAPPRRRAVRHRVGGHLDVAHRRRRSARRRRRASAWAARLRSKPPRSRATIGPRRAGPLVAGLAAARTQQPRAPQPREHQVVGDLGELGRFQRDDAGAVGGVADRGVLLEDERRPGPHRRDAPPPAARPGPAPTTATSITARLYGPARMALRLSHRRALRTSCRDAPSSRAA